MFATRRNATYAACAIALGSVCAGTGVAAASSGGARHARVAATLAPPPLSVPPELAALEQKMAPIRFNSVHFGLTLEVIANASQGLKGIASISEVTPAREGASLTVSVSGQGVASLVPSAGQFAVREGKKVLVELRLTGGRLYTFDRSAYSYDGHRPWVTQKQGGTTPLANSGLSEAVLPNAAGSFAGLLELLGRAQKIEALGPAIIHGQLVSSFAATYNLADLFTGRNSTQRISTLNKQGITSATIELFVAANGMPVRLRTALSGPATTVVFGVDILGLEVPVSVQAPPVRKTITRARLRRIQRHHRECITIPAGRRKHERICAPASSPEKEAQESPFGF